MDPVSQCVVGAVAAASPAKKTDTIRLATVVGGLAGMLADADIFIRSAADPLLNIEYHRHFTHALLFIPLGGAIAASLLWLLLRGRKPFGMLYAFSVAGYATSGLLDACTSYGTRLYWPFSDARVAWNIISIVDPVYTLTILVLVILGMVRRSSRCMRVAAAFALGYLALGVVQRERAFAVQAELVEQRGHGQQVTMATVKPSLGNLVLWRSLYRYGDRFHVDAVRVGPLGGKRVYQGETVAALDLDDLLVDLPVDSVLAHDLLRFEHFSAGYLAYHPALPGVIGDCRYAFLPGSIEPLWGITFDRSRPADHVRFGMFREAGVQERKELLRMVRGKE
jgi:inner membrane protein